MRARARWTGVCWVGAIGCGVVAYLRAYRHYGLLLNEDVVLVPALHLGSVVLSAIAIYRHRRRKTRGAGDNVLLALGFLMVLGLAYSSIELYLGAPR